MVKFLIATVTPQAHTMSNIKQLDDLKDFATYKLDLAKSLAKVGNVRRAGWDMQTAFPQEGTRQDSFSDPKVAKNAQKNVERQNTSIDFKTNKLIPQYELAVKNAPDGTSKNANQLKLEKLKTEIDTLKLKLPELLETETKATAEFNKVDEKKVELEGKLKKLQEMVGGDTE